MEKREAFFVPATDDKTSRVLIMHTECAKLHGTEGLNPMGVFRKGTACDYANCIW